MSRRRKFVLIGIVVVSVGAIVAAKIAGGREESTEVRIETVGRRDLVATVTASGQIAPKTSVDIASDITGRIISIPVQEGDLVERGQLLLRIDPTQFEAGKASAEAAVSSMRAQALQATVNRDQARRTLDRTLQLKQTDPNLVADEQLETAQQNFDVAEAIAQSQEFQVRQAEASLRQREEELSKTILRAPMGGKITRMAVEEGEVALASTFSRETGLLMTIADLSVIQVDVRVDETDVVRLQLGDSTEVTIDAFTDTTFVGRVTKVSQSAIQAASAASGNTGDRAVDYDVEITLDNPPPDIRPDLSATSKIITDTRGEALSIPIISLTVREHRPLATENTTRDTSMVESEGVFVVNGGLADFRPVKVGIAGEEHFEVLSGLLEGDSIVAGPYQTIRDLQDSTEVRASNADEDAEPAVATVAASPNPPSAPPAPPEQSAETAVEVAAAPEPLAPYSVQVAAVQSQGAAMDLMATLRNEGYEPRVTQDSDGLYKVRVGSFSSRSDCQRLADELRDRVGGEPFVVENST